MLPAVSHKITLIWFIALRSYINIRNRFAFKYFFEFYCLLFNKILILNCSVLYGLYCE